MNFGDKLRSLRTERSLTQPQLAESLGIEQSYLSKLENGKSLPSNDMLQRLLDVLGVGLGEMLDGLDAGSRNRLRQLPDVATHLGEQKRLLIGNRRRWLFASALLVALGGALVYAGMVNLFFSDTVFEYRSAGVVLDGEPKELFRNPVRYVSRTATAEEIAHFEDAIMARLDEVYVLSGDYRGNVYNVPVRDGSRTYRLVNRFGVDPWQSKLVAALGVFLGLLGLAGFLLDSKLSR